MIGPVIAVGGGGEALAGLMSPFQALEVYSERYAYQSTIVIHGLYFSVQPFTELMTYGPWYLAENLVWCSEGTET